MGEPWLLAIFVAGAVALAMSRRRPRATAVAVVAGVAAFLGVKAVLLAQALPPSDPTVDQGPVLTRIVEARWASLTKWLVFDRRADTLTQWQIEAGRPPMLLLSWPVVADSPLVRDSRSLDTVRNFLDVHELAFAGEVPAADGGSQVLWSDLRFCWRPRVGGGEASPEPVLSASTPAGPARIACGLWFGGAFDRNGRVDQTAREGRRVVADACAGTVTRNSTLANGVPALIGRTWPANPCEAKQASHSSVVRKSKRLPPVTKRQRLHPVSETHGREPPSAGRVGFADERHTAGFERGGHGREERLLLGRPQHVQHVEEQHRPARPDIRGAGIAVHDGGVGSEHLPRHRGRTRPHFDADHAVELRRRIPGRGPAPLPVPRSGLGENRQRQPTAAADVHQRSA